MKMVLIAGSTALLAVCITASVLTVLERGSPPTPADLHGELPDKLSGLGLFADVGSLEPAGDAFAYSVRHPLWSDGAKKLRHAYLPAGGRIEVDEEGGFTFPNGTLLSKTFDLDAPDGRHRIETRVLYKWSGRWQYGAYEWNEDRSDATLTDGEARPTGIELPGGDTGYVIPSRLTCLQCHAGAPDVAIGFAAYQLEDETLDLLALRGHLDVAPSDIPHREIVADDDLERRALGYLAGNCAHCHNPESSAYVGDELDLRHFMAKAEVIDVESARLSRGDAIHLVKRGAPQSSVLFRAFTRTLKGDEAKMPPVGNQLIDPAGADVLRRWIESLRPPLAADAQRGGS